MIRAAAAVAEQPGLQTAEAGERLLARLTERRGRMEEAERAEADVSLVIGAAGTAAKADGVE